VAGPTIAEVLHTSNNRTTDETLTTAGGSAGDTLVIIYGSDYYTVADMGTPTSSAGTPTLVETSDAGDLYAHIKVYTVALATSGAKTVTIPAAINCDIHGVVLRIPGGALVDVHAAGAWNGTVSTQAAVAPSVTTGGPDRLLIAAWIQKSGDFPNTYTLPGGMTRQADTDANPFSAMCVASEARASAGATGTRTATWPSGLTQWCAVTIALASASQNLSGTGTITATATLTGSGVKNAAGTGAVSGTATLSSTGSAGRRGTGAIAASANLTASGTAGRRGTGALAAAATLTTSGVKHTSGTGSISVIATLTGGPPTGRPGTLTLSGAPSATLTPSSSSPTLTATSSP
jgi:hypothetical protein